VRHRETKKTQGNHETQGNLEAQGNQGHRETNKTQGNQEAQGIIIGAIGRPYDSEADGIEVTFML